MIGKCVSVGDAVRTLRSEIDGGALRKFLQAAFHFFLFLAKLSLVMLAFFIVDIVFGTEAAFLALFLLLAWLAIPGLRRAARWALARAGDKGILIGTAYGRITEQYANADTERRQGGNALSLAGQSGLYRIEYGSEPNPHVLVVGSSSSGKTSTTKAFICRNYLAHGTRFLMIDWDGDQERWAGECGSALWKVPLNFKINMFRLNGMDPEQRASMAEDALLATGRMTMLQATKIKNLVLRHYLSGSEPDLKAIIEDLRKEGRRNNLIIYRLSAIWRVVGEEPEPFWSSIFQNNTVISLAGLNESEKAVVAYFILHRICELFEKEEPGSAPRLLVVVDEAWQLLNSSARLGVHESLAEKVVRIGRRYGFGIITSTQQLGDVPEPFINSSALIFLHNYRQLQHNRLALNQFDLAYLGSAAQGECLVFDRLRYQKGQVWPDYVKVRKLDKNEYAELKAKTVTFKIPSYVAPQHGALPELPAFSQDPAEPRKSPFRIPAGAPSPAEHAAMLALYYSAGRAKASLIAYIKEKGWIRSPTTLYGYAVKPGVLDGIVSAGFARKARDKYELSEEGLRWVDPERILANQSDKLGSEEHKRLLISTIHKLHESNMLVVTSRIKHSPDLIAWPVNGKKRYLWDAGQVKGYEIQTSMRKDSVEQNAVKSNLWNVEIEWVSNI